MAMFDRYASQCRQQPAAYWRMLITFAAALVHGMGFAAALRDAGLDARHQFATLAGFNVGIEFGQLAAATAAYVLAGGIQKHIDKKRWEGAKNVVSYAIPVAGAIWFIKRLLTRQ
jgi:hypothetical protein